MTTPIPAFFTSETVGQVWRVPYQQRAADAIAYRQTHKTIASHTDTARVCLLAIDVQNTFCQPEFELFVGGRSGVGAVEDTRRLCEFIYRNLGEITEIIPTMDTHNAVQIFHSVFWVNDAGEHPAPMTMISFDEVEQKKWQVNPVIAKDLSYYQSSRQPGDTRPNAAAFAYHYVQELSDRGKYPLTIWPYHSMLGGIGHALVPAFEEACFFHSMVRSHPTRFEIKGDNPLTENYSVLSPEVLADGQGQAIAQKNNRLIQHLLEFDAVIIAGQAKSHCVAWTVSDLLSEIKSRDLDLAKKIYLLEDCTSPVVVPDVVDFTQSANETYQHFEQAGMNIVRSVESLREWPHFLKES
ncbi:isochorismatase [cf. Phormidesmis sp. LEGE 11477]|uniref:isochorismatase n=1 Tax=cf. Phormidesmis sp. LEGE 11477 TaxID=1828680 RepID=UPI0018805B04|nr:isochorismatase [cf. Phormidesmis sp. LEGE 11477]MBE9060838.1 isochorismatase [cf. Phormidesmis sp. LEGE 11477]